MVRLGGNRIRSASNPLQPPRCSYRPVGAICVLRKLREASDVMRRSAQCRDNVIALKVQPVNITGKAVAQCLATMQCFVDVLPRPCKPNGFDRQGRSILET